MAASNFPFVSIILPIRNEAATIERGLRAILAQDYQGEVEILIADGLSSDNTRALIQGFSDKFPQMKIRLLDNPGRIVPTGINLALRQIKGDIVIRVDGHTSIAPDYVRGCVESLQRTHADNVGGRMNAQGTNTFGKVVALATSTPFGIGGGRFHYSDQEEWVDTVYMGAWPRQVFEKIGLFDEELVRDQDDEFNYRLRASGGRILLNPKIKSEYMVRSTPRALWRQYFQYGYWKVRVLQKHPFQMRPRQFMPPTFVFGLFGSFILAFSPILRPLSLIVPVLYLLANISASAITSAQKGGGYMPLLPLIFAMLHLSYGLGFLVGLIKFANRWGDRRGKVPDWSFNISQPEESLSGK